MKRWIILAVPMLLIAAVAFGQLITGGQSGGSGISSVQATNGIQGNGVSPPLALITPVTVGNGGTGMSGGLNVFQFPNMSCGTLGASIIGGANQTVLFQIYLPQTYTVSHIGIPVTVGDAVGGNAYDIGLYNSTGALVADTGAQPFATATYFYFPFAQGTVTLPAGAYFEGYTGNAVTARINGCGPSSLLWQYSSATFASPTTTAGALATSITVPTPNIRPALANVAAPVFGLFP